MYNQTFDHTLEKQFNAIFGQSETGIKITYTKFVGASMKTKVRKFTSHDVALKWIHSNITCDGSTRLDEVTDNGLTVANSRDEAIDYLGD